MKGVEARTSLDQYKKTEKRTNEEGWKHILSIKEEKRTEKKED